MVRRTRWIKWFPVAMLGLLAIGSVPFANAVETRVAGLNNLVVIPPGAHERGLPAVRLEAVAADNIVVDIPPTLHVHRNYYSGDQSYQGPILEGGPTVVVANHPKTGERLYIEVTLPPGAPLIAYCKSSITYIYPNSRVAVHFSNWHPDTATVKYHSGRGGVRATHELTTNMLAKTKSHFAASAVWQSLKETTAETHDLVAGTGGAVGTATAGALDRARQFTELLPGVAALKSAANRRGEMANRSVIRGAEFEKERGMQEFLPTNR